MKKRIALFDSKYGVSVYQDVQEMYLTDYVRITEYVEVDFPDFPLETVVGNQVSYIDKQIDEIKNKAMDEIAELQTRKAELLALKHEK